MYNYKSKLNQIRVVLGLQVKLASEKLSDGMTVVEAEEFIPGAELYVVAEDGSKTPAPAGNHILESGKTVIVDEAGKIVSIEEAEAESEGPKVEIEVESEAVPVKMEEEPIDGSEPVAPVGEGIPADKIAEELMKKVAAALDPLMQEMAELRMKVAKMEEQYAKFAKAPAAGKIPTLSEPQKMEFKTNVDIVDKFNELKNSFKK